MELYSRIERTYTVNALTNNLLSPEMKQRRTWFARWWAFRTISRVWYEGDRSDAITTPRSLVFVTSGTTAGVTALPVRSTDRQQWLEDLNSGWFRLTVIVWLGLLTLLLLLLGACMCLLTRHHQRYCVHRGPVPVQATQSTPASPTSTGKLMCVNLTSCEPICDQVRVISICPGSSNLSATARGPCLRPAR